MGIPKTETDVIDTYEAYCVEEALIGNLETDVTGTHEVRCAEESLTCNSGTDAIGIRADANEEVAMGHVMRCITIAKELKKLGKRVIFFTADDYAKELLSQAGIEQVCLCGEWNDMEKEIPLLREELIKRGCRKLLVDSYYANASYFEKLSDLCKLIYIDDCFDGIYPVDMLINYNAYHVRFNYEEAYKDGAKLLLGTAYVPLREEFGLGNRGENIENEEDAGNIESGNGIRAIVKPEDVSEDGDGRHVFISVGGGDVYNALAGILSEALKDGELKTVIFHTVVGRFNPNAEELERISKENPNVRLHYDVKNMAKLMEKCSAAVSAAGTVLFELSAMRIPSIFFVCADNQRYDSEFFEKENRMLFAGDIRVARDGCIECICSSLKKLLNDENLRRSMKNALQKVTDGRGAERIAAAIAGMGN